MRPSSLPILAQSPKFVSSETSFAEEGTDRHAALESHFRGDDSLLNLLDPESRDSVVWAAEYIRLKANMTDYPIVWEKPIKIELDDFSEMTGRPDAVCNLDIFDFKWRPRDYEAQMAAYALGRFQAMSCPADAVIRAHLLFGATKHCVVHEFTLGSASKVVQDIVDDVNAATECRPSDYCSWCKIAPECPVLIERANTIAASRKDWMLEQYHTSQINDPVEMARALNLAGAVETWADAVKHFALEMVTKQGLDIPGWELKTKTGKRICKDIQGAFGATGLSVPDFLACCDVRFADTKTRIGLEGVYKTAKGIETAAAAKRELKAKLEPFCETMPSSQYLSKVKSTKE